MKKSFLQAIILTEQLLGDIIFTCVNRMKPTFFTRVTRCKMGFRDLILFELYFVKKTLRLELDAFFKIIKVDELTITKQGYSQARQKISPNAFIQMADKITNWYYDSDDFGKFNGYRLSAIDASVLEINNSARLRQAYGFAEGTTVKLARAKASCIYDLQNDMIITSKIAKYTTGEREIAVVMIKKLIKMGLKNDLILFDRGYPSKKFFAYLDKSKIKFLMRAKTGLMARTVTAANPDRVIDVKVGKKMIKIRVIRIVLDTGVEEFLVTNLLDENFSIKDFKVLYFKRWGIEVKFNELKSRLQIQNFTGDTVIAVEQDFYAAMYLSNMIALAKSEANEEIRRKNVGKKLKYEYHVNTNILIGKLKNSMILLFLEVDPTKRRELLMRLMVEIVRNVQPIRPGRSNIRKMGLKAHKHPMNQKQCL